MKRDLCFLLDSDFHLPPGGEDIDEFAGTPGGGLEAAGGSGVRAFSREFSFAHR